MLTGVQRLINIKIAKAYRTVSKEALCKLTGLNPFILKEKKRRNFISAEEIATRN